jgi:hypothetical protein
MFIDGAFGVAASAVGTSLFTDAFDDPLVSA